MLIFLFMYVYSFYRNSIIFLPIDFFGLHLRNNIIIFVLPPHRSHVTQPLDVGAFEPLQ